MTSPSAPRGPALPEQGQRPTVVDERERIARDLHDGIIQSIYGVVLALDDVPSMMAAEPDEASRRIDRAIDSLNRTIHELRNVVLGLRSETAHEPAGQAEGAG